MKLRLPGVRFKSGFTGFLLIALLGCNTGPATNPIIGRWVPAGVIGPGPTEFTPTEVIRPRFKEKFPVTYEVKGNEVRIKFKNEEQNLTCQVNGDSLACNTVVGMGFEMKRFKTRQIPVGSKSSTHSR